MHTKLIIKAPAKINLTLDIKRKREDGYHELETVMHQIDLLDIIYLEIIPAGIHIKSNSDQIPDNDKNLAWQAANLLFTKYGIKAGINIFIEKNIPVGAGLAGGSSDAAAVLKGINQIMALNIKKDTLMEMGAVIGSDVPFCILGGTAVARGRGEILEPIKQRILDIVIIKPDFQLSTAEVYQQFKLDKVSKRPNNAVFLNAWLSGDIINNFSFEMENVLESVSVVKYPQIAIIKNELLQSGAVKALMSGSGPSVFGIYQNRGQALKAWQELNKKYREAYLVSSYKD